MRTRIALISFPAVAVILCACDLVSGNKDGSSPDGGKNGVWRDTTFYASGKVNAIRTKLDFLLDGLSWSYYETGNLQSVNHFKAGVVYGWSFLFFETGIEKQETFTSHPDDCQKNWDESGALIGQYGTCLEEFYKDSTYSDWKFLLPGR